MIEPFLSFAYEGYEPGGPEGIVLDWFHDWLNTSDATTSTDWYVPLYLPRATAFQWNYLFRQLSTAFHLSAGGFTWNYTRDMPRRFASGTAINSEHDLRKPGIIATDSYAAPADSPTVYSMSLNDDGWNGPGSTLDLSIQLELFRKQLYGGTVEIPHMLWQQDGTLITPSLVITGTFTASSPGTDFGFIWSNKPATPEITQDADIFLSHGGASIDVYFTSTSHDIDAWSLDLSPNLFFGWDGVFDEATGLPL